MTHLQVNECQKLLGTTEAGRGKDKFFPRILERAWFWHHSNFELLVSRIKRQDISVVLSHLVRGHCFSGAWKLVEWVTLWRNVNTLGTGEWVALLQLKQSREVTFEQRPEREAKWPLWIPGGTIFHAQRRERAKVPGENVLSLYHHSDSHFWAAIHTFAPKLRSHLHTEPVSRHYSGHSLFVTSAIVTVC